MLGSICPICWGQHAWTDRHEIVATATSQDPLALITELSSLGVTWPSGYAPDDPAAQAYGLLHMIDKAGARGLDCNEVANEWVISRARQAPYIRAAVARRAYTRGRHE
jgi:hypothetical protein